MSAADSSTLHVVQITDCHLGEQPGTRQLHIDTDASLQAVLALIRRQQTRCDLLLATGDLSDHGSTVAYRRLREYTRDFGAARWLPGNHDAATTLRETLLGDDRGQRVYRSGQWQVIMLDTSVPGEVGGFLAASELAALRASLSEQPARHALICLHHPVLPIDCAWLDQQRVANADEFWRELQAFPQVRAVLCGHVHQPFDHIHQGVRVLTTPSTAWQFAPRSADFCVDRLAPGYRWLRLHADGRIETDIERVTDTVFFADTASTGY